MENTFSSPPLKAYAPAYYEIVIQGHLGQGWEQEFLGFEIQRLCNADGAVTRLVGAVYDQPALAGMLLRLIGNGYPLICVAHDPRGGASPGT